MEAASFFVSHAWRVPWSTEFSSLAGWGGGDDPGVPRLDLGRTPRQRLWAGGLRCVVPSHGSLNGRGSGGRWRPVKHPVAGETLMAVDLPLAAWSRMVVSGRSCSSRSWELPCQRVSGSMVAPSSTGGGHLDVPVVSRVAHPPVN
jgi:hypothetical protein